MIPRLLDRLNRLEGATIPPTFGKHLIFKVEAPRGTPVADIVTFLKDQGHAIQEDDEVFVMNLGAHGQDGRAPLRDLSAEIFTEDQRAAAPAAGKWPTSRPTFTFNLDSPGGAR